MGRKKLTYQYVAGFIKENTKYELISKTYIGFKDKLYLKCPKHGDFYISFECLKRKQGCNKCGQDRISNKLKHSFVYVKNWIKENTNCELISKEYLNNRIKLHLKCPKHGDFYISFECLKRKQGCNKCGTERMVNKRSYSLEYVKKWVEENTEYLLLSKEYINCKYKLKLFCKEHGVFEMLLCNLKSKKRCKKCSVKNSRSELECKKIIESITKKNFSKVKLDYFINPLTGHKLELDGYSEDLNIAFEYDGEMHYINSGYGKQYPERVVIQKKRDLIKNVLCKKYGIDLIRIPYFIENKEDFIKSELQKIESNVNDLQTL